MILCLFFTRNVSLEIWMDSGLFEREKLLYHKHLNNGNFSKIYWLTYGSKDKKISKELIKRGELHSSIKVCQMPYFFNIPKIGSWLYSFLIPIIHWKVLRKVNYLKTNQMDGSWSAVLAKWIYKKPLIARTGYTQSIFLKRSGKNRLILWLSSLTESVVYRFCDIAIVASYQDKKYLLDKYRLVDDKITVVPNYIDITKFHPLDSKKYVDRLIFVGRLNKQKNLFGLIDAVSKANVILDIFGDGELKEKLKLYAIENSVTVNFMGIVPNSELPQTLNHYRYFIIPSFYEGMPKALLEAMACGLVCIGTDVSGINEVIDDSINGFLSKGVDAMSIYDSIVLATESNHEKLNTISESAFKLIKKDYSLEAIVSIEKETFYAQG
jgi:glycosyltransferase involved in cell wall biosynthesis